MFLQYLTIPERSATWLEALQLMGEGWGAIFIVILIIMTCIYGLNRFFRKKPKS